MQHAVLLFWGGEYVQNDLITAIKEYLEIPAYLESLGYTVQRHGSKGKITLAEHDSFVYDPDKRYCYWNSRDFRGDIIDLYQLLNNCDFDTALRELRTMLHDKYPVGQPKAKPPPLKSGSDRPFVPPNPVPQNLKYVYAYLINTRAIHPEVVRWLVKHGYIYADDRHNLCYVSRGYGSGAIDYAAQKGTGYDPATGAPTEYRHAVEGGNFDARFAVNLVASDGSPRRVRRLIVGEAAVDLFSIMTFLHLAGQDFAQYGYLSLECCYEGPLGYHLARHPEICSIELCQDHDEGGAASRAACRALLQAANFAGKIHDKIPYTVNGDWNLELQKVMQKGAYPNQNDRILGTGLT